MLFDVGRYDLLLDLLADWLIQDIERKAAAEQMCADATSIDQPLGAGARGARVGRLGARIEWPSVRVERKSPKPMNGQAIPERCSKRGPALRIRWKPCQQPERLRFPNTWRPAFR
jgi:hypothetical protein